MVFFPDVWVVLFHSFSSSKGTLTNLRTVTFAIYRVLVNSMSKLSSRYNKIDATFFSVVVYVIFTMDASSSESPCLNKKRGINKFQPFLECNFEREKIKIYKTK